VLVVFGDGWVVSRLFEPGFGVIALVGFWVSAGAVCIGSGGDFFEWDEGFFDVVV
jgi:hypothetical protein